MKKTILTSVLVSVFWTKTTYAYLDPGTGSIVAQAIIASIVGVSFFAKTILRKIASFFHGRTTKK